MTTTMKLPAALALLALAACAHHPRYPVTNEAKPFTALDASESLRAPDVATRVTGDRLVRARSEPQNWLTYYGAYDGQRYSALDQITTANVKNLKLAWQFQAGVIGLIASPATYAFEATPIVVDGVMYVSGWDGYVWALDAATGKLLWRYRHAIPLDVPLCCGNVNRGVAVAQGKVFFATQHGHVELRGEPAREPRLPAVLRPVPATGALVRRHGSSASPAGGSLRPRRRPPP